MRIGTSLTLVAVGLILAYAVDFEVPGIEVRTLGSILFFVGLLGLAVTVWLEVASHRRPSRPARPRAARPRAEPRAEPERWEPVVPARRPAPRDEDPPTRVLGDETRRLPRR